MSAKLLIAAVLGIVSGAVAVLTGSGKATSSVLTEPAVAKEVRPKLVEQPSVDATTAPRMKTFPRRPPGAANVSPEPTPAGGAGAGADREEARAIVEGNKDWLFQKDKEGGVALDSDGEPLLSPIGVRYTQHVVAAERLGIARPTDRHQYAARQLRDELNALQSVIEAEQLANSRKRQRLYPSLGRRKVALVADGTPCEKVAADVFLANSAVPSPLGSADAALVVVRSNSPDPLRPRYDSPGALLLAAGPATNHSGRRIHVYVYTLVADRKAVQIYAASEEWAVVENLPAR